MKRNLYLPVCLSFILAPAMAQDVSVNVNSAVIPELRTVPVIDGDLSDWAGIPETVFTAPDGTTSSMNRDGDSPAAEPGTGDLDIVLKVAWDNETNALYFGINVKDDSFVAVKGMGSSATADGWNNERLEIVIDGLNTGDPASTNVSGFHQQYGFDLPNTWDPYDPNATTFGFQGLFNPLDGGIAPSTTFVKVPVHERIQGSLDLGNEHHPWNLSNQFVESAAQIRVTSPNPTEWVEAPVEINWEIKLVIFEFIEGAGNLGYDINNAANKAQGYLNYFQDPAHDVLDLAEGKVIGFSPQQNDADIWDTNPVREHQTNTTGFSANWDSSENLSGLILGPTQGGSDVADWFLQ